MARKKDPKLEAKLLFDNNHTCCICRTHGKQVQIHHIDGNPGNHRAANLAVVCLDCHSLVTSDAGLGRKYMPAELRHYKRDWEALVRKKRGIPPVPVRVKSAFKRTYWSCEIRRLAYEVYSAEDGDNIRRQLGSLESISVFDGLTTEVLAVYREVLSLTAFSGSRTPASVIDSVIQLVSWLAGPHHVPMGSHERKLLRQAVEVWSTMGQYASEFNRNRRILSAVYRASLELLDIAVDCRQMEVARVLIHNVSTFGENCMLTWEEDERAFPLGRKMSRRTLRDMSAYLKDLGRRWSTTRALITRKVRTKTPRSGGPKGEDAS